MCGCGWKGRVGGWVNDIIKKRRLLMWLECDLLNVLNLYIYKFR